MPITPTKPHTRDRYDAFVSAYRKHPEDHATVAKLVGVGEPACRAVWERGWSRYSWARPVREVLANDAREARHRVNLAAMNHQPRKDAAKERRRQEQEREREVAVQTRGQEARMIATARGNVIALQAILARVLRGGLKLAEQVEAHLIQGKIDPEKGFRLVKSMGSMMHFAAQSSKAVLEAERLRLGLPSAILGLAPAGDMTATEMIQDIARGGRAYERARRLGIVSGLPPLLTAVQGSDANDVIEVEPKRKVVPIPASEIDWEKLDHDEES